MSTSASGATRRKLSIGTSDCPPASTFVSRSPSASSSSASSSVSGALYSNRGGFTRRSPCHEGRDGPRHVGDCPWEEGRTVGSRSGEERRHTAVHDERL